MGEEWARLPSAIPIAYNRRPLNYSRIVSRRSPSSKAKRSSLQLS